MKDKNSLETTSSHNVLSPLVNILGRPLSSLKLYKMVQVENVEAQNLEYQKFKELFEDLGVFLIYGPDWFRNGNKKEVN